MEMETVNITSVYTKDGKTLYYIDHPSADEAIVLNDEELSDLYQRLGKLCKPTIAIEEYDEVRKPHLIIHETDCHGCGNVIYGDKVRSYTYDDGSMGDAKGAVEGLIEIGFINPNDVTIIEGDEIYQHLNIK